MSAQAVVVIAAGGTGGHIFPGLAVVEKLAELNTSVVWIGTKEGMESRIVPAANVDIRWIKVKGLRGKGLAGLVLAPFKLAYACLQSIRILTQVKASAVLGMGGFVSGPVGIAALLMRKPLVLHEQNAIAGMTNRYLSRFAKQVFCAMPGVFPSSVNARVVGNPMRAVLTPNAAASEADSIVTQRALRVLVVGGSRGAQALNDMVPASIEQLPKGCIEVIHQTGENDLNKVQAAYESIQQASDAFKVSAFIDDMASAYAWADIVLCRAGAMTVSELSAVGLPSILVPFPHAVDDHQTMNARYLSDAGAAVLIQQSDLTASVLAAQLQNFIDKPELLNAMAVAAAKQYKPDAAQQVADALVEVNR